MNKIRITSTVLIIFVWLVTAAFQPMPVTPAAVDAPAAFNKLAPTSGSTVPLAGGVKLEWDPSTSGATYEYCLKTNSNPKCPGRKWIYVGTDLFVNLQGLTPGVTYYWQVRATDATGTTEANGGWWSFTTQTNALLPGAFAKVTPADASLDVPVSSLTLSWDVSARATRYEYCFDTVNNNLCDGTWTNAGAATTVTLTGLIYDKIYYWQVRAVNAYGSVQADDATWWWFWTVAAPPGAFSKLTPEDGALDQQTSVTLSWQATDGATYQYCIDAAFGSTCASDSAWVNTGATTSASLGGLANDTTYYWQVRALNGPTVILADNGAFWSFTTRIAPPGAFGKTSPGDGSLDQPLNPTLTWGGSAGTNVTYEYCYSTTKTAANACDGTWYPAGANTSASLSGLSNDTLYYWQVRAVNTSGATYANGSETALWNFTTQISPPWAFDKISPASGADSVPLNVNLGWSASTGADKYYYCVDKTDDDACDPGTGWVVAEGSTTALVTSLDPNTTYYWQVKAENSQGTTYADGNTWSSFTTISVPSGFSKISPMDGVADQQLSPWLYWLPSDTVEYYEYCLTSTLPVPPAPPVCSAWQQITPVPAGTYLSFNLPSPLAYATTYYWQVRAVNGTIPTEANLGTWWSFTTVMAPPVVGDLAFTTPEDTPLTAAHLTVTSANYSPLTYTLVGSWPAGSLSLQNDGTFTYNPVANYDGTVTFQFIVSDGHNPPVGPKTATITVTPVNDPPVLQPIANLSVVSSDLVTFTVVATDADTPYGDTLSYSILEVLPAGATFNPSTGVFRWFAKWLPSPASNVYSFTVVATDADLPTPSSVQQVVQITVLPQVILLPVILR